MPAGLQGSSGYQGAAGSIIQGSVEAEKMMRKAAAYDYAHRAGGLGRGFSDYRGSLTGNLQSQGMSPDIVQKQLYGARANAMGAIGEAGAQTQGSLYQSLAELYKGTGTELAGLKLHEMGQILQMFAAYKARKQNATNSLYQLGGTALRAGAAFATSGASEVALAGTGAFGSNPLGSEDG